MNRVRAGQHIKIYCFYSTGVITSLMFALRFASSISNFRKGGQPGRQAGRQAGRQERRTSPAGRGYVGTGMGTLAPRPAGLQ